MNNRHLTLLLKKAASLIISAMVLLNVFSIVLINNAENIEMSNKYAADTITKYCSMAVLIPMKIVSNFFKTSTSADIETPLPIQTQNKTKKSKKDNQKEFFQCAVVEDEVSSIQFGKNLTSDSLVNVLTINNGNTLNMGLAVSTVLLFIVLFSGNMILARGDTENIIKKNICKIVRLV